MMPPPHIINEPMGINAFFKTLNPQQKKAVEAPRQPVLLLAGPGTGKTRTLIGRIAWQVRKYEIPPARILALTFSNKAAEEMRQRLTELMKNKVADIHVGTIHAFCLEIIKKYPEKCERRPHFTVADETYTRHLLGRLIRDRSRENINRVINGIRAAFSMFLIRGKPLPPFSAQIYEEYDAYLKKHNLLDYDQILYYTERLLRENEDILEQYRFMYQAIHVDEFQDTDILQYGIIRMLAMKHQNIFVVADDDQSIYAWRGANPENIRSFMTDFKIKKPVMLDINYRSGPKIIATARDMVVGTDRIEPHKEIFSGGNVINEKIQPWFFDTEEQEQEFIVSKIREWHEKEVPFSEMAVLYPRHNFVEALTMRLLREQIPFQQARKALSENPVLNRLQLYLRLVTDPLDDVSWQALVRLQLGYDVDKHVEMVQKARRISYRRALYELSRLEDVESETRHRVNTFLGAIGNWINLKNFYSFEQLIREILFFVQKGADDILDDHIREIAAFDVPDALLPRAEKDIVIHAATPELTFLAGEMCKRLWPGRVRFMEEEGGGKSSSYFMILLAPLPGGREVTRGIELFRPRFCKGRSVFTALLRYLQQAAQPARPLFEDYVVFDLETTGRDPQSCGIVEIAAVRVEKGEIVDRFESLVNPQMEIEEGARAVHGIGEAQLRDAPLLADIWADFKNFIGDRVLVAHNGFAFDFIIINRYARLLEGQKLPNVRYDSLILARQLFPGESNSIDALAERFNVDPGERHRALADVEALHHIFQHLMKVRVRDLMKKSLEPLFEYVALANFHAGLLQNEEDKLYFIVGAERLISPYSTLLDDFAARFMSDAATMRVELRNHLELLRPGYVMFDEDRAFLRRLLEWVSSFEKLEVDEAVSSFLSALALVHAQDSLTTINAVSLLTFHAAKGLEFRKVIIIGMEDDHMPSFFAKKEADPLDDRSVNKKMDEQKRLLYVGITRARDELLLIAVKNRNGKPQKSSPFLRQILRSMRQKT